MADARMVRETMHCFQIAHHIALYVGESVAGFAEAFENCDTAGIVWVNPRFSDKADSLDQALAYQQFRFKNIVNLAKTGI